MVITKSTETSRKKPNAPPKTRRRRRTSKSIYFSWLMCKLNFSMIPTGITRLQQYLYFSHSHYQVTRGIQRATGRIYVGCTVCTVPKGPESWRVIKKSKSFCLECFKSDGRGHAVTKEPTETSTTYYRQISIIICCFTRYKNSSVTGNCGAGTFPQGRETRVTRQRSCGAGVSVAFLNKNSDIIIDQLGYLLFCGMQAN